MEAVTVSHSGARDKLHHSVEGMSVILREEHVVCMFVCMYVFFWYFLLAYSWCTILYITGVQYSESQFLNYASFIDLPTQRSNPGLPHCRQILYQLSYQGSHSYYKILAIFPTLYIYASIFLFLHPFLENTICSAFLESHLNMVSMYRGWPTNH